MKPTIDKSRVMKRAWNIYRGNNPYSGSFSESLRRAWFVEKDGIRYAAQQEAKAAEAARLAAVYAERRNKPVEVSEEWHNAVAAYYANARPGTYVGD